jgi:hypothetical protein
VRRPAGRTEQSSVAEMLASEPNDPTDRSSLSLVERWHVHAYASSSSVSVKLMETDVCPTHSRAAARSVKNHEMPFAFRASLKVETAN